MPMMDTPMAGSPALSFEVIAYKFRKPGIIIKSLSGEYSVGYLNGQSDAAEYRETLAEAIELAEVMAREAPAVAARPAAGCRRKRHPSMACKANKGAVSRRIMRGSGRRRLRRSGRR
jgi:hypothetical protein